MPEMFGGSQDAFTQRCRSIMSSPGIFHFEPFAPFRLSILSPTAIAHRFPSIEEIWINSTTKPSHD